MTIIVVKYYTAQRVMTSALRAEASRANWANPADIKAAHHDASFIGNKRVIFNIKGNDYRLVVALHYDKRRMFIRFVGTHSEYDKIDAAMI